MPSTDSMRKDSRALDAMGTSAGCLLFAGVVEGFVSAVIGDSGVLEIREEEASCIGAVDCLAHPKHKTKSAAMSAAAITF